MRLRPLLPLLGLLSLLGPAPSRASLVPGLLAQADPFSSPSSPFDITTPLNPATRAAGQALTDKIAKFTAEGGTLPAPEAAARWLELFDAFYRLTAAQKSEFERATHTYDLNLKALLRALPPTAAWDAIVQGLKERAAQSSGFKGAATGLVATLLSGHPAETKAVVEKLYDSVRSQPRPRDVFTDLRGEVLQLHLLLAIRDGNAAALLSALEQKLAEEERGNTPQFVDIPDLLLCMTPEQAKPILRRALISQNACDITGPDTRRLAARIALENAGNLRVPHWQLVKDSDTPALFEALTVKFGNSLGPYADNGFITYGKESADTTYLLFLLSKNRTIDAVTFVRKSHAPQAKGSIPKGKNGKPFDTPTSPENTKHYPVQLTLADVDSFRGQLPPRQVLDFLKALLKADPTLPFWEVYLDLSFRENAHGDALAFLRATAGNTALPPSALGHIQRQLGLVLLSVGKGEEGAALLEKHLSTAPAKAMFESQAERQRDRGFELGLQLARAGQLLKRPKLTEAALEFAGQHATQLVENKSISSYDFNRLLSLLCELDRAHEAEKLVRARLAQKRSAAQKDNDPSLRYSIEHALEQLCLTLDRQGKYAGLVDVLQESPEWKERDLWGFADQTCGGIPFLAVVAHALAEKGDTTPARRVLERVLLKNPGHDLPYELLSRVADTAETQALLQTVAARHPFESRAPLGLARLLLAAGKLPEAENQVLAALALIPRDTEAGSKNLLLAQTVLAEIQEKKGDPALAATRDTLAGLRLAAEADAWWQAGLSTQALALYEKALAAFPQDCHPHAQLGLLYEQRGNVAKAEEHYRSAFELMPQAAGLVDYTSLARVLHSPRAAALAEKAFAAATAAPPGNVQSFQLLGTLRNTQGRHPDAVEAFQQAVKLDPNCFQAWKQLNELKEKVKMSQADQDAISLALYRFAPDDWNLHVISHISNLRHLWDAALAQEKIQPALDTNTLYPLGTTVPRPNKEKKALLPNSEDTPRHELEGYPLIIYLEGFLRNLDQMGLMR